MTAASPSARPSRCTPSLDCGGLHGHVKVAPRRHRLRPRTSRAAATRRVAVSRGRRHDLDRPHGARQHARRQRPAVGVGAKGTVYFGYQAADGTPRVAVSHDKGKTWTDDQDVGAQLRRRRTPSSRSSWPVTTTARPSPSSARRRAATTRTPTNFNGVWHLYVATTYDGGRPGPRSTRRRATRCSAAASAPAARPAATTATCSTSWTSRSTSRAGSLVGYADGCTGACAQPGGAQNFDAYATIARQQSGNTLYAAYDALPNLTPTTVSVTRSGGLYATSATVANTGKAPARGVTTRLLVDGVNVATAAPVDVAAGRSTAVAFPGVRLGKGTHTVVVVADPDGRIRESDESDNRRQTQVTR